MSDTTLPAGTVVAQRLRVLRVLGEGGMGAVYEVEHLLTKHRRALKLLHASLASMPGVVERFLREASAAGRIGNAHIVETFDAGTTDDGSPYLVMELLDGYSLAAHLARRGRLEPAETIEIFRQVCDGVQAAHDTGIVHRDLKPENIFLMAGTERFVKILDFGISKFDPARTGMTTSTLEGSVLGTPFYMSPEQVRGAKDVDSAADVYALGVVLYECLTGKKPFEADTLPHLAVLIAEGRYEPLSSLRPDLPAELDAIIARVLSPDRRGRYPSARAFAEAFEQTLHGSGIGGQPTQFQGFSIIPPARRPSVGAGSHALSPSQAALPSYAPPQNVSAGTPAPVERVPQPQPSRRSGAVIAIGAGAVAAAIAVGVLVSRQPPKPEPSVEPVAGAERAPSSNGSAVPKEPEPVSVAPGASASVRSALDARPAPSGSASAAHALAPRPSAAAATRAAPGASARRSSEHGLVEDNPFK